MDDAARIITRRPVGRCSCGAGGATVVRCPPPDLHLSRYGSAVPAPVCDEPAWPVFLREVTGFVSPGPARPDAAEAVRTLTARERNVLARAAAGDDNDAIAAA